MTLSRHPHPCPNGQLVVSFICLDDEALLLPLGFDLLEALEGVDT